MDKSIRLEPLGKGVCVAVSPHHTFGTDAVLLAHFSNAKNGDKYVDLGTGCGIIPFLIKRDKRLASCVGVDISKEAIDLFNIGVAENGFTDTLGINADFLSLKGKTPFGCNTLVTCNPPYKAEGAGIQNPDSTLCTARHETACCLEDVVSLGARLLQTGGRLCFCHRPERAAELICLMSRHGVEPKRMRNVAKCVGEKPWLVLVEGRRSGKVGLTIEPTLYIQDEKGNFSKEMLEIYGPYKEDFL